jgi:hypothetical protein
MNNTITFYKSPVVEEILNKRPVTFASTNTYKVRALLSALEIIILNNIEGDVVELGCETGESSIYIRLMLDYYKQSTIREYHVYDSWEGVPTPDARDLSCNYPFTKGCCACKMSTFVTKFENEGIVPPIIHTGWFAEIPSFNKTFTKMTTNGFIVVDDYDYPNLPGCKKAVQDFLIDKIEKEIIINNYSDVGKGVLVVKGAGINNYSITYGTADNYKDVTIGLTNSIGAKNFNDHFGDDIPGVVKNLS